MAAARKSFGALIQGDLSRPEQVEQAVAGAEAVLLALGQVKGAANNNIQIEETKTIITAIKQHGAG